MHGTTIKKNFSLNLGFDYNLSSSLVLHWNIVFGDEITTH